MCQSPERYFVLNKPIHLLSQFKSDSPKHLLLGSLSFSFPEGTHAIGRLDKDSEGLLLLTTDRQVTSLLFQSAKKHIRTYLVKVDKEMHVETLQYLRTGVSITIHPKERYMAVPAAVDIVQNPSQLYNFIGETEDQSPCTWLLISLTEGKYRQVRKMVYALKHRCLRLIRLSIEDMKVDGIAPGTVKEFSKEAYFKLLGIEEVINE